MSVWRQGTDIAWVEGHDRFCLLNLERLDQLPVILEGSAVIIFDAVDGTRDTDAIIEHLKVDYHHISSLAEQVRSTLTQFEQAGLIHQG